MDGQRCAKETSRGTDTESGRPSCSHSSDFSTPQAMDRIWWAGTQPSTMDGELTKEHHEGVEQKVINFGNRFYPILLSCTEQDPFFLHWQTAASS